MVFDIFVISSILPFFINMMFLIVIILNLGCMGRVYMIHRQYNIIEWRHQLLYLYIDYIPQMEFKQQSKIIDPYSILLQQFHKQEEENFENKEYLGVLNDLKMQKTSKISCIKRKKEERNKLLQRTKLSKKMQAPSKKLSEGNQEYANEQIIGKIDEDIMLREQEQLNKLVCSLKQQTEQVQSQLTIFNKKDNDVKRYWYQSKRNLEHVQAQIKNNRIANNELIQKQQKQIQSLQNQKQNLHQELRYLSDLMYIHSSNKPNNQIMNIGKLLLNNLVSDQINVPKEIKEIFTKKKLQENLRVCYIIYNFKHNWVNSIHKSVIEIQQEIRTVEEFRIFSKNEIIQYFSKRKVQADSKAISKQLVQFYESITDSINRYERISEQLNTNFAHYKAENQMLQKSLSQLQENKQRIALIALTQTEKDITSMKKKVDENCGVIFRFSIKMFNLIKRMHRLEQICSSIMKENKEKQKLKIERSDSFVGGDLLGRFSISLKKSPEEVVFHWNQTIKNNKEGMKFLERIVENDMFRALAKPEAYIYEQDALQNQIKLSSMVFNQEKQILVKMKSLIIQNIITIDKKSKEVEYNKKKQNYNQEAEYSKYVVESKDYYRRDNFKIIEKMERLQLKRKGLFMIPKYERSVDSEIIENSLRGATGITTPYKILSTQRRKQRLSTPISTNFISSYREKVNKAGKKIRDLLNQLDDKNEQQNSPIKYRVKKFHNKRSDSNSSTILKLKNISNQI